MMRRLFSVLIATALAVAVPSAARALPADAPPVTVPNETGWYLALGDSLANGYLHGSGDHETEGYVGHVLEMVQQDDPKTKLVNLACSGETTASMVDGGKCAYDEGSQLAQAVEFLRAHGRFTRLVTIDIGGNDIAGCGFIGLPKWCTDAGKATIAANLPTILGALRAAAGPGVQIVVLNYYDPFLALWLRDTPDSTADDFYRTLAVYSVSVLGDVNAEIAGAAALPAVDADVADVATAFHTGDFTPQVPLPGYGTVPTNVAQICILTTMCTYSDFHANPAGYAVMAEAVRPLLD